MIVIAESPVPSNASIQFCGVTAAEGILTGMLQKGSQTRAIDLSRFDLSDFSQKVMRRAWRQAARRGRRQHRQPATVVRRTRLITPGGAAA